MTFTRRGFTLIEVLVAMLILTGGIMMVSLAWSGNFLKARKATIYYDVSTLLERKMAEIEAKYRDKFSEIPEDDGEAFEDAKNYRWKLKSRAMKFPDLAPLLAAQQEGGVDETLLGMIRQMTEYLNKTIKEVRVTIYVKSRAAKKEQEYAATQYFIDYTQDFAAAAGAAGAGGAAGGGGGSSGGGGGGGGGAGGGGGSR